MMIAKMDKNIKTVMDARDYINNLDIRTVTQIVYSPDRITYDNTIIDDFLNYCRGLEMFTFDETYDTVKNSWVTALSSVILNAFDTAVNKE